MAMLSLFVGMLGVDQFYLGWWAAGAGKLCTLGGLGFWWIHDAVRIGGSPVRTADGILVANDVPHYTYVLVLVTFACVLGFSVSIWSIERHRIKRLRELLLLRAEGQAGLTHYSAVLASGGDLNL